MRCLLATIGSRGDVEPFVLLAERLAARGHEIVLALDPGHHAGARERPGITRERLGDLDEAALAAIVARGLAAPTPSRRSLEALRGYFDERSDALGRRMTELAAGAFDRIVVSEHLLFPDGDRLRWPTETVVVCHTPAPRQAFLALNPLPCRRLAALSALFRACGDPAIEQAWTFTGFWVNRVPGALPDEVERFLAAGSPPFFLTMGSMLGFDAAALSTVFVEAARAAGGRAIVQRGWAGLSAPPAPDALTCAEVDYAALFPRCAAIFAHGGTGTTALAMHAGRPLAFLPLVGDQELWARNLVPLGTALGRLDPRTPRLDNMLLLMRRALDDPEPTAKAAALAHMIRAEDGLAVACDAIERP